MQVPLHALHQELGARFVEFGGYEMPILYSSILEEHSAVRTRAGLFDVSHMSNLWVRGADASKLLAETLGTNPDRIKPGRASYTVALREDGTIIDDLIYYKFSDQEYHVVPNAGMNRILASWLTAHAGRSATIEDATSEYCIFALQGPRARDILRRVLPDVADVAKFQFRELKFGKRKGLVSGTGYTGEDGVELVLPKDEGVSLFPRLLSAGQGDGLVPVGLGARDTLRLEKGYCLAPHEFAGGRTPLEAGLGWVVHWDHEFVGKPALEAQRDADDYERLIGLRMADRGIPRQGYAVHRNGARVGVVTSGTLSPSLNRGIALAYVDKPSSAAGTEMAVEIRGQPASASVAPLPFL